MAVHDSLNRRVLRLVSRKVREMNEERLGYWRWLTRNLTRLVFSPVVEAIVGTLLMVTCLAITVGLVVEYGSLMLAALTGFLGILGFFILTHGIYREEERDC